MTEYFNIELNFHVTVACLFFGNLASLFVCCRDFVKLGKHKTGLVT